MSVVLPRETTKSAIEHPQDNPTSTSLPPPSPLRSNLPTPSPRRLVETHGFPSACSHISTVSLALPWELIERVIEHSWRHSPTLYSFSLTCRQLHPRSIRVLFADVHLKNMRQFRSFRDMVQDNADLGPLVLSLTVDPRFCNPSSLLPILPNISLLVFDAGLNYDNKLVTFHPTTLMLCKQYGRDIQNLCIIDAKFATPSEFCRVLSAFPNMSNLTCEWIDIELEGNNVNLYLLRQRLSQQLRLRTLEISEVHDSVASLLLELCRDTVEELCLYQNYVPDLPQWTHLRSLTLTIDLIDEHIKDSIEMLRTLKPQSSSVVVLNSTTPGATVAGLYTRLSKDPVHQLLSELDRILVTFPKVNFNIWKLEPFCTDGNHSDWTELIGKCLPKLYQKHPQYIALRASSGPYDSCYISVASFSPDGRWVATGSSDSVIVLRDSDGAGIIHEWIAHFEEIDHLVFSQDSRYLASASNGRVAIWDLAQSSCQVATFHTGGSGPYRYTWSSDGDLFATHAQGSPVRFWDVRRGFQTLREIDGAPEGPSADHLWAISPDFRWLLFGDPYCCCLWDVSAGEAEMTMSSFETLFYMIASFNPTSTLLAAKIPPDYTAVTVWDLATGDKLFVLQGHEGGIDKLVFSPDSQLLLSVSNWTMNIWDMRRETMLVSLEGHSGGVNAGCFSPCGNYVASGSEDGTVKLWRVRDGSCLATFSEYSSKVVKVVFSPDGSMLWSAAWAEPVVSHRICDLITE